MGGILWIASLVSAFLYGTQEVAFGMLMACAVGFLLWAGFGWHFLMVLVGFSWGIPGMFALQPVNLMTALGVLIGALMVLLPLT